MKWNYLTAKERKMKNIQFWKVQEMTNVDKITKREGNTNEEKLSANPNGDGVMWVVEDKNGVPVLAHTDAKLPFTKEEAKEALEACEGFMSCFAPYRIRKYERCE